jgi:hypothetical protein
MEMDTTDLIARARAGDLDHLPDHFADLLEQARAAVERDPRAVGLVINSSTGGSRRAPPTSTPTLTYWFSTPKLSQTCPCGPTNSL